jgi:hypothetical protein
MTTKIRHPFVAGRFYPGSCKEIQELMESLKVLCKDFKISVLTRGNSGDVHVSESIVDYVSILFHG